MIRALELNVSAIVLDMDVNPTVPTTDLQPFLLDFTFLNTAELWYVWLATVGRARRRTVSINCRQSHLLQCSHVPKQYVIYNRLFVSELDCLHPLTLWHGRHAQNVHKQ